MSNNLAPRLTSAGTAMIVSALNGDSITFTKICIGNGDGINGNNIGNPLLELGITNFETGDNFVMLTCGYDNSEVPESFYAYELGVFAQNSAGEEFLYAYSRETEHVEPVPGNESGRVVETQLTVVVSVGTAEEVHAVLTEASAYASKEAFQLHVTDRNNPHGVTAADVGLGNVPNSTLENIVPDYETVFGTVGTEELVYTDNVGKIFAKLKRSIKTLIDHVNSTTVHITSAERTAWNGKAAGSHNHAASAITSGSLAIARGGTGAADAANARKNLGLNALVGYATVEKNIAFANGNSSASDTITIPAKSGYTPVCFRGYSIASDGTSGSIDTLVTVNNIFVNPSASTVSVQLRNTYTGANHIKMQVYVVYIRNT